MEAMTALDGVRRRRTAWAFAAMVFAFAPLVAQDTSVVRFANDSVTVRFVETDIRAVIQALGRYLPKPVLVGNIQPVRVSLETPAPVDRPTLVALLKGLVESQSLEFVEDSAFFRIAPRQAEVPRPSSRGAVTQTDSGPVQLFVIRLRHARAYDVAATVNLLFGGGGEFAGRTGLSTGTLSDELRRNVVPTGGLPTAGQSVAPSTARQSALSGTVTVVPDELTNSLLIRASQADFDVMKEAVDQLDIRPLQVLIEVLIVETRHDRSLALGADWFVPPQSVDGANGTGEGSLLGGGLGDLVIRLLHLGRADVDATIRAAASRGDVRIVSQPVLLASNNQEARFLVGSQRPFVQVSRSLPTDAPSRDQVIQYRDVGTKLTVRPTINQDGYVSLLIQQEINQATSEVAFDAPVISTREAVTRVLVKDGQTIVLGGMRDQQRDVNAGGVPILSSLPFVGGLFGSSSRRTNETELYLFLTPRILRTDADADSVTVPRLQRGGPR
ncbi:MAG TPA: secretin N-terminal domain-containing protein [Gemmatimonadales bacterium]|jgi:general secretion pathway protein D|nr:secretin N-terminal domain-containing protein [Gemmatimonadales bacterium]